MQCKVPMLLFLENLTRIEIIVELAPLLLLTVSLPVPKWAGDNTDLPSSTNISKMVTVNTTFTATFFKKHLIRFLMVCRLIYFALVVFKLFMFNVCGIIGVTKIEFSNISGTERVKQN